MIRRIKCFMNFLSINDKQLTCNLSKSTEKLKMCSNCICFYDTIDKISMLGGFI